MFQGIPGKLDLNVSSVRQNIECADNKDKQIKSDQTIKFNKICNLNNKNLSCTINCQKTSL